MPKPYATIPDWEGITFERLTSLDHDEAVARLIHEDPEWASQYEDSSARVLSSSAAVTQERQNAHPADLRLGLWAARRLLGFGNVIPDGEDGAEIGLFIGRKYAQRGLGTAATRALTHAASESGFDPVTARIHADNTPSQRMVTAAGYRRAEIHQYSERDPFTQEFRIGGFKRLLGKDEAVALRQPDPQSPEAILHYRSSVITNSVFLEASSMLKVLEPQGDTEPLRVHQGSSTRLEALAGKGFIVSQNMLTKAPDAAPQVRFIAPHREAVTLIPGDIYYIRNLFDRELVARLDQTTTSLQTDIELAAPQASFYTLYDAYPHEIGSRVQW
jgi:RimJ/RimL family protein N-acetyltransferase